MHYRKALTYRPLIVDITSAEKNKVACASTMVVPVITRKEEPCANNPLITSHQVDNGRQLQNVSQLKLYQYQYRDGVMTGAASSEKSRQQVGVLAQELRQIIPDAVHETVCYIIVDL